MIDIKVYPKELSIEVYANDLMVKDEKITKDELKGYMEELSTDEFMLDALRLTAKKMKVNSFTFKDIR